MSNPKYIPQYSFDDYKIWKGDWELIDGLPIAMSPSPKMKHQIVAGNFYSYFNNYLKSKNNSCNCRALYETDWKVNNNTVLKPDVAIVCPDKITDFIITAPVLIMEVLSPSTHLKDRNTKFDIYEENGVKYYIMIDPDIEKVEIFQRIDNKYKEVEMNTFQLSKTCEVKLDFGELFI